MALSAEDVGAERSSLPLRLLGALALDGRVFEEIKGDPRALPQALLVVVVVGLARGVGSAPDEGLVGLVGSPLLALLAWLVGTALVWGIGVKRLACTADYAAVVRVLGFAAVPLLLLVFCVLPLGAATAWIWVGAHGWSLLVLIVAVREALDASLEQALVVCILALGVTLGILFVLGLFLVGLGTST
jgi:hypothetical protein